MNGDRGGSQCGLTSLLPMSCRGRAAAFARDLHSRLRNLGASQEGECEHSWLTQESSAHRPASAAHTQRDLDTFYDFELECESPSSPAEDNDNTFPEKTSDDTDLPFYDVDTDLDVKDQSVLNQIKQTEKGRNGFKFATSFYAESPIKLQPAPRENGHVDKPLYSPITFEGCARQNSFDEIDSVVSTSTSLPDFDRLNLNSNHSITLDSDSEFESAKSEPSDDTEDVLQKNGKILKNGVTETNEQILQADDETINEEFPFIDNIEDEINGEKHIDGENKNICTEVIISEVCEKESSPALETDPSLESVDTKAEEDGEDDRPQRVRRCSSLKTGKTPPGTPGRKKIVRFADVLGLDLADVKTFMDEIPVVPKSAYDDLSGCEVQNSPPTRSPSRFGALTLVPLFQVPRDMTSKLEQYNVCLESSRVCDGVHVTICGSVRVRNLDFHKTVHIRYTMNRWKTFTDLQATYVQASCDGYSDRFQFILYAPCISSGQRLELAVRFQCKGQQFWDNNCGANYCFDCLALGTTAGQSPLAPTALHPTVDWHPSFY